MRIAEITAHMVITEPEDKSGPLVMMAMVCPMPRMISMLAFVMLLLMFLMLKKDLSMKKPRITITIKTKSLLITDIEPADK
jgi:hypothetical protein